MKKSIIWDWSATLQLRLKRKSHDRILSHSFVNLKVFLLLMKKKTNDFEDRFYNPRI